MGVKKIELKIIVFIGSPMLIPKGQTENNLIQNLEKMAMKLKKNKIIVDIFSFGEIEENLKIIQILISNLPKRFI